MSEPAMALTGAPDFGKVIQESTIKTGLRELQPGIHFDMGTNLGQWLPKQDKRQGIFYDGKHICSMDRGPVSEFTVWEQVPGIVEIDMVDAESDDDANVFFMEILPNDPGYETAKIKAIREDDNYKIDENGKVFRYQALKMGKVKGECLRIGWRHTFERLIAAKIPGVTRQSIAAKFGVDMNKFPVGPPEELAELREV